MVLPPSPRLWVGMLVVMVVLVDLPRVVQKCIFDVVQAQARVVPAAPISQTNVQLLKNNPPGRRASVTQRRSLRNMAPPTPDSPQPIRIRTWIPAESNNLSEAEKERMAAAVEEAVRKVSSLLSVSRAAGPLLLSRDVNKYCKFLWRNSSTANYNRCGRANKNYRSETCLDVTIPNAHLAGCDIYPEADSLLSTELRREGAGLPDTDFLLYLNVQATDKCRAEPNVLAYAVHCQTDTHGRPVAGVVVLCRDRLTGAAYSHQATVQTVIHELFHALGFSKDLFHTWTDCSSRSQGNGGCSPRGKVTHSDGSGQMRIYTPSVISALQRLLASTDPQLGGPLENLDVPLGKASSHWESRVLQGSVMAAVLGDPTTVRIDPVTLAALQDTGWYSVDMSRAQGLVWGDGEGSMFGSLSNCQNKSSSFFCSAVDLGNGSECWKEESGREEDWSDEMFGFHSRCFFSNLTRQNQSEVPSSGSSVEGRCYRHRCTGPNRYQIQVSGTEWADCPAGDTVKIKGYRGLVHCPDRRLCLYDDITPPSYESTTFPASATSDPYEAVSSAQDWSWLPPRPPAELTAASVLGLTVAVCVLAAAVVCYRKCCSCRVRIHAVPEHHTDV
ncbi:hypothetical protein PBY51_002816 [Eleginops maclovinus]|uniref:Leishmanolysin-like peptidase n=1 Tax=Eleginops maclovinus TaxID=56733 RepID=A0AAN7XAV4_ELEMC|nr:hypothetical protein PBY51_002816 [Eleginops maclovinus]